MATMIVAQAKVVSYHNRHHEDDFIPLAIEILDVYTSRWMTSFIVVPTWHGQQRVRVVLLFFIIPSFNKQRVSMAFQRVQALSCNRQLWQ